MIFELCCFLFSVFSASARGPLPCVSHTLIFLFFLSRISLSPPRFIPSDTRREADDHKCPEEWCWEVCVRRHKHGRRTRKWNSWTYSAWWLLFFLFLYVLSSWICPKTTNKHAHTHIYFCLSVVRNPIQMLSFDCQSARELNGVTDLYQIECEMTSNLTLNYESHAASLLWPAAPYFIMNDLWPRYSPVSWAESMSRLLILLAAFSILFYLLHLLFFVNSKKITTTKLASWR